MNEMSLFISEEEEKKRNLIHYEGDLGVFDYDPREFDILGEPPFDNLHYCGNGKSVDLPDGCIKTNYMFLGCKLPNGFSLGKRFNTSTVTDMCGMFKDCILPDGFSLGKHFDTSNVTDMSGMFFGCKLPDGFSLGEHFNTSNVTIMYKMFRNCIVPAGFSLGEHFDTSKVTDMGGMFRECELPRDFLLGEHFNIRKVTEMKFMFGSCKYNDISIYDYFKTQDTRDIIIKLRKYKKSEDTVVDNELTALMLSVSEELQLSTSTVQRMMKSYLKSLINK